MTKGSAAAGLIRIGVGWIRNCSRPGVSKGSIAVFNNSGSIAPAQLVRRSRSWTRPNAPSRAEIASPACGKSTAVRTLWLIIDCTIARVFFTLWCNSSSMSRCSFSALSRLAASVAACSRSLRRVAFSSSSLKSPSLISAKPASWGTDTAKQARGRYFRRLVIGNPSISCRVLDAMDAGASAQNEAPVSIIGPSTTCRKCASMPRLGRQRAAYPNERRPLGRPLEPRRR